MLKKQQWIDPFREEYDQYRDTEGLLAPPVDTTANANLGGVENWYNPYYTEQDRMLEQVPVDPRLIPPPTDQQTMPISKQVIPPTIEQEQELARLSARLIHPQQITMARRMGYDPNGDPARNLAILQHVLAVMP